MISKHWRKVIIEQMELFSNTPIEKHKHTRQMELSN